MTVVYLLVACVALGLTADTLFALGLMLYAWEHPERLQERAGPEVLASPQLSFSALVPARAEATVIQGTVARLCEAHYPSELLEIIVICQADDEPTIAAVQAAAERYDVRLETYDEPPFNKPHALECGRAAATNDVICVFDAEDDVHPEIFNVVNTLMCAGETAIVQGGVQLMNPWDHWFSALNCLEYFLYFGSRLHFNARVGMVPLGGNTVFISRELIDRVDGWNIACLTEDAEVGVRLSALGEPIRVVYDERWVTREETPHSVGDFIRQRTRWHQGFLQILGAGEWKQIPGARRRILARLTFAHPLQDALLGLLTLLLPLSIIFLRLPDLLTLVLLAPLYALMLQMLANMVALVIFCRSFDLPLRWRRLALIPIVFLPYQWLLSLSACRAVVRHLAGRGEWEKTAHRGAHRATIHGVPHSYPGTEHAVTAATDGLSSVPGLSPQAAP